MGLTSNIRLYSVKFPGPKRSWVLVVFLKRLSAKNLISRKSVTGHDVTLPILPHESDSSAKIALPPHVPPF